ncbi:MAG: secretin N-terminal domain-containing protein [Fuerstiella sp.]|nr:hypothetical protein [Fuerstiella sp.]
MRWFVEQNFPRGSYPGMSSSGSAINRIGMGDGGGVAGLFSATKASNRDDSWFPIIVVAYADDLKPDQNVEPGWSKPIKTAVLASFRYEQALRYGSSRGSTGSGSSGLTPASPASIARPSGQPLATKENTGQPKTSTLIVYSLRHTQALDALRLVQQLFSAETGVRIVADNRTNSLLVSASDEKQAEVMEILKIVDAELPADKALKATERRQTRRKSIEMEIGPADVMILKGSKENVAAAQQLLRQMSSQQLLDRSKSLSDKAIARARDVLKYGSAEKDLAALKQTVQEDFDVQQQLQLAEIEFLKARLADLERRVRQKEQLKNRIIDRRVGMMNEIGRATWCVQARTLLC